MFYSRHRTETGEPRRFFRFAADMTPDETAQEMLLCLERAGYIK